MNYSTLPRATASASAAWFTHKDSPTDGVTDSLTHWHALRLSSSLGLLAGLCAGGGGGIGGGS